MNPDKQALYEDWRGHSGIHCLDRALSDFLESTAICTSFQAGGTIILSMAEKLARTFRVVTIDTGLLPRESQNFSVMVLSRLSIRSDIQAEVIHAEPKDISLLKSLSPYGEHIYFESRNCRELCCYVRKILPQLRALESIDIWITGLTGGRGKTIELIDTTAMIRTDYPFSLFNSEITPKTVLKLSPLANWNDEKIEEYIKNNSLEIHPLYSQGYASIGCQFPCTIPVIAPGECRRAGRWPWEMSGSKECGMHNI